MRKNILMIAAAMSMLAACDAATDNATEPNSNVARGAASVATIAGGLTADDGRFGEAAKASGLDATLAGPGPYTVLIPSNAAFDRLPAEQRNALMKPESRAMLTRVLTGHILPGEILAADIAKAIDNGKGKATLATFGGGTLIASRDGDNIVLTNPNGEKAVVAATDERRSNGIVHRIDAILMPR